MSEMMSPDLMALLGGAAPGPAAAAPEQSSDLAALFGGAGAPVGEAPVEAGSNLEFLREAITLAQRYADAEDDEINTQTALQCIAKLQSILANEQKEMDGAMSGKASPRMLRSAYGG